MPQSKLMELDRKKPVSFFFFETEAIIFKFHHRQGSKKEREGLVGARNYRWVRTAELLVTGLACITNKGERNSWLRLTQTLVDLQRWLLLQPLFYNTIPGGVKSEQLNIFIFFQLPSLNWGDSYIYLFFCSQQDSILDGWEINHTP